jgi:N-acetyl-anhydromuramyl-L-alanine amidase AmpD
MSNFREVFRNSPNSRGVLVPTGIILHHTAGTYAGSVSWCLNPTAKVSYHCIVNTNGERTVLVPDNVRAWHAGVSTFQGRNNCNEFMLGIAVSGNTAQRELTAQEVQSVAEWCVRKMRAYNFGIDRITTHRHVAPNRKTDVDTRAERRILDEIRRLTSAPTGRTYAVVVGDSVWGIATRFGITPAQLVERNGIVNNRIVPNQVLRID